jgi:fatty acid desaturase
MSTVWQAAFPGSGPNQVPTPDTQPPTPALVCIANISPQERRKRLIAGAIQFAAAIAILAALIVTGVDRWWRLPLFLLFAGAAAGFFQWRDKT